MRNAFGTLLVSPAHLSRTERIDELHRLTGRLLADTDIAVQWLGECMGEWLRDGGSLDAVLGVRAPRGSRRTPQLQTRTAEIDAALLRLANLAGTDRQALALLRGDAPCAFELESLRAQLRRLGAPTGPDAIRRARARHR